MVKTGGKKVGARTEREQARERLTHGEGKWSKMVVVVGWMVVHTEGGHKHSSGGGGTAGQKEIKLVTGKSK